MTWLTSVQRDIVGVRFAVNVFIGMTVTWYVLKHIFDDDNPIWAIASMVAASDPRVQEAARMFKSCIINVLVGCAVGLLFVVIGGSSEWKLPIALAITVLCLFLCGSYPDNVASGTDYSSTCYRGRS